VLTRPQASPPLNPERERLRAAVAALHEEQERLTALERSAEDIADQLRQAEQACMEVEATARALRRREPANLAWNLVETGQLALQRTQSLAEANALVDAIAQSAVTSKRSARRWPMKSASRKAVSVRCAGRFIRPCQTPYARAPNFKVYWRNWITLRARARPPQTFRDNPTGLRRVLPA
jgi:hypothetical protein